MGRVPETIYYADDKCADPVGDFVVHRHRVERIVLSAGPEAERLLDLLRRALRLG